MQNIRHPRESPVPVSSQLPWAATDLRSLSVGISYKWDCVICALLCLAPSVSPVLSVLQHASVFCSFLLTNIPLDGCNHALFIRSLVAGHLGCFHNLTIMNNAKIFVYKFYICPGFFFFF